jgi:hypothetical protein
MADQKISALTSATTPLAGTEVLPIVQSGSTVKVAVSDLTAGRNIGVLGVVGTTTNNNATAGCVGEYVSSTVSAGSLVALTSSTATDITTISLTAGDWDVAGIIGFGGISGVSVVAFVSANASETSASISPSIGIQVLMNGSTQISTVADMTAALPVYRYSLATTTTIYLVARASYTTGSIGAYGTISARRVR